MWCGTVTYGEKNPEAGLTLAMRTAETVKGSSDVLTGLAVLHAAEAWAMLGQRPDCEQALSQAEACFIGSGPRTGRLTCSRRRSTDAWRAPATCS